MKEISDYVAKVEATFSKMGEAADNATTAIRALSADFVVLRDTIGKLQASTAVFTPEDQALLDESQAQANAMQVRFSGVADALVALDAAAKAPVAPAPVPVTPAPVDPVPVDTGTVPAA